MLICRCHRAYVRGARVPAGKIETVVSCRNALTEPFRSLLSHTTIRDGDSGVFHQLLVIFKHKGAVCYIDPVAIDGFRG